MQCWTVGYYLALVMLSHAAVVPRFLCFAGSNMAKATLPTTANAAPYKEHGPGMAKVVPKQSSNDTCGKETGEREQVGVAREPR